MAWQSIETQHRGTKRTMGLLYIILSLLLNDEVHSVFEVKKYPESLSWQTALQRCDTNINWTFAVPVVNLSSMTVLDKIDFHGEAWVGYYQTYEYFLFLVCVPLTEIESSVSAKFDITRNVNRPGMCYSLCGLQGYIGLQDGLCYCIETGTFTTPDIHSVNSSCIESLHCPNGMLCGNQVHDKISVYKNVSMSSNNIRGDGSGCLIVTKGSKYEMTVTNCSGSFRHLCESNKGQALNLEESLRTDQWVFSINDCAKNGKKPTTFIGDGTNFLFPNSSQTWWTSVVRDLVIRNSSESRTIKVTPLYEGFLRNSNGGIKLEFIRARNNPRKMLIACMSANESSTPGADTTTGSTERASTTMSSSAHETTIAFMTSEQPINEQENLTIEPAKTTMMSAASEATTTPLIPVLTVILPVGLAALALITVVTLSVVCWRRRKEKATNNEEASKQKSTETVVPRNSESQQTYYEHEKETLNQLKENNQGNVSSEYDSLKEYNAPFSAPTGNLYDTSNFNIGDGTYAITFSANTLRQVVPANSYDHVRMKKTNHGKYDHVKLHDQRNSVNDIGPYDQGNALACDNTYYDTCE